MKKAMLIINPTSGGEKALDYKEKLENKAKEYFEYVETKITEKMALFVNVSRYIVLELF